MDTKTINQFGQEILCYKLKTARQKKLLAKKGIEKEFIQLDKKRRSLRKIKNDLPFIDLEEPYQKGWKRFFILRDDVARSNAADFFNNILHKINTVKYSYRKDFKKRKRVKGKKADVLREQFTKALDQNEFGKLNFIEKEAAYFSWQLVKVRCSDKYVKMLVFNEPWRFTLKIIPNIITQVKMIDVQLESQIRELDNYMESNNLEPKINKAKSRHTKHKWDYDTKEKYKFEKMNVVDWLNEANASNWI